MSDTRKTKSELIAELNELRKKIAKLENSHKPCAEKKTAPSKTTGTRGGNRVPLKANIEFIGAFDLIKAKAVNVSATGISFKTSGDLPFEMRYKQNGETVTRTAHLIWVKHTEKDGYYFGLRFVDETTLPQF
jgi:hypothetical protein